jgi:hypothetical protein
MKAVIEAGGGRYEDLSTQVTMITQSNGAINAYDKVDAKKRVWCATVLQTAWFLPETFAVLDTSSRKNSNDRGQWTRQSKTSMFHSLYDGDTSSISLTGLHLSVSRGKCC